MARCRYRAVLHREVRHGQRLLEAMDPGRSRSGMLPRPVPQLVLRAAGHVHHDGEHPAVQDPSRPRAGSRRGRPRDAQVRRQRHLVRRRRRKDGRRFHALALLPPEPGEQFELRLHRHRPDQAQGLQHLVERLLLLRQLRADGRFRPETAPRPRSSGVRTAGPGPLDPLAPSGTDSDRQRASRRI